ncbi:MAG: KamA family radical SAM protein [Spirochaetales bacterium]|nr:KamA family radical SAM protein [Spirochaetales bacterium]
MASCIHLSPQERSELEEIAKIHPIRVTRHVMDLMDKEDPEDPIRKMYLPSTDELDLTGAYDTSGEADNTKAGGLQHKYEPTALLLSTNICAIYCRYCFRKRMVGLPNTEVLSQFDEAITYIEQNPEISNVLISGGDSFMLDTSILAQFLQRLSTIPHLKFIRFGTKTLASLPQRIIEDEELIRLFREHNASGKPRINVVTHINHPREIVPETMEAVSLLNSAGVTVSCQTVLLKGINDDVQVLCQLMNGLVEAGIVPYYLFQCRPVKRVQKSFQISLADGVRLIEEAKGHLAGMAKRFKYALSHPIGKIEIVGLLGSELVFKLHDAKYTEDTGTMFTMDAEEAGGWLPADLSLSKDSVA